MLKKLLFAVAMLIAAMGCAFAQVDVNKADQAALDGVKGIGPKISKAIIDERKRGGDFKDWMDFEKRVKGIGGRSAIKLSQAGLTVNEKSKPGASTAASKSEKKDNPFAGASARSESKKDVKDSKAKDRKDDKGAAASALVKK